MKPFWILGTSTEFILSRVEGLNTGFGFSIGSRRKRRLVVLGLYAMLFALCSRVDAQQQVKIAKIGEMVSRGQDRPGLGTGRELFRQSLRELGYVEGKNISFETRSAEGKTERFTALAEELVRLKVDVLVTSSP